MLTTLDHLPELANEMAPLQPEADTRALKLDNQGSTYHQALHAPAILVAAMEAS